MGSEEVYLSETDVRSLVRHLGEAASLSGGSEARKRHLMGSLSEMIGADRWIWAMLEPTLPGEPATTVGVIHDGFSEDQFASFLAAAEHPESAELNAPFLAASQNRVGQVTRLHQQLDPDERFPDMAVFPLWHKAGIGSVLLSSYAFENGKLSLTAFYRKPSAPRFSERDSRLAHVVLSEVPWLHASGLSQLEDKSYRILSPRQRTVLNLLLEGHGRKQIAAHLGITANTVAGYIKKLYRHYDVHSHAELMRHFQYGDGGDR